MHKSKKRRAYPFLLVAIADDDGLEGVAEVCQLLQREREHLRVLLMAVSCQSRGTTLDAD
jgi:hypothetical protein